MKNITLTAEDELIEKARTVARAQHTTLNLAFRGWLQQYAAADHVGADYDMLMSRLAYVGSKGPYSRDEMNER